MLRKFGYRSRAQSAAPAPRFGQPQDCPWCGGPTFLGRIDVRARVQHQHCFLCQKHSVVEEAAFAVAS